MADSQSSKTPIDLDRCRRGMKQLRIEGAPRVAVIEEAIAGIQRDPMTAMRSQYIGVKNYASFGDQREDHEYGFGPKHGTIVFSIGRDSDFRSSRQALDHDAIYLLEAYRDFGTIEWAMPDCSSQKRPCKIALTTAIREFDRLTLERGKLCQAFEHVSIEAHV